MNELFGATYGEDGGGEFSEPCDEILASDRVSILSRRPSVDGAVQCANFLRNVSFTASELSKLRRRLAMETFSTMLFRLPATAGEFMSRRKNNYAKMSFACVQVFLQIPSVQIRGIRRVRIFSFFGSRSNFANKFFLYISVCRHRAIVRTPGIVCACSRIRRIRENASCKCASCQLSVRRFSR